MGDAWDDVPVYQWPKGDVGFVVRCEPDPTGVFGLQWTTIPGAAEIVDGETVRVTLPPSQPRVY